MIRYTGISDLSRSAASGKVSSLSFVVVLVAILRAVLITRIVSTASTPCHQSICDQLSRRYDVLLFLLASSNMSRPAASQAKL